MLEHTPLPHCGQSVRKDQDLKLMSFIEKTVLCMLVVNQFLQLQASMPLLLASPPQTPLMSRDMLGFIIPKVMNTKD